MFKPSYKLIRHSEYDETIIASINFFPKFNSLTNDTAKEKIELGIFTETPEIFNDYKSLSN